jgi:hypothetical protein
MEKASDFYSLIGEKPRKQHEILSQMTTEAACKISLEAESDYKAPNLLMPDGTIRTENFAKSSGGIYDEGLLKSDWAKTFQMEYEFSGAKSPRVAEFFAKEHGCDTPEKVVAHWKKEREKNKSGMFEQAMFTMLYKFLKEEFIVVRTAPYDDYKAGVDNLIIDKKTGDVICAFDEVHDSKGGEYTAKKIEKVKSIAQRGGASVRYGLTVEDNEIKQAQFKNVPVLAISLASEKFAQLLPIILNSSLDDISEFEKQIMADMVRSLEEQVALIAPAIKDQRVNANLDNFNIALQKINLLVQNSKEKK